MSNIPKARDLLDQAIKHLNKGEIDDAKGYIGQARLLMRRVRHRPSVAPAKLKAPDPILKDEIARYALSNPKLSYSEIGRKFFVNPGRVSEAVRDFML